MRERTMRRKTEEKTGERSRARERTMRRKTKKTVWRKTKENAEEEGVEIRAEEKTRSR